MSRGPETGLEELCALAAERLEGFELARDIAMRAAEEHDTIGIEPFRAEGGLVLCIGSTILSSGAAHGDALSVVGTDLQRLRTYPAMTAQAHFVGLWPRTEEAVAALYTVEAPFQLAEQRGSTDFATAAATVLDAGHYRSYERIKTPASSSGIVYGKDGKPATVFGVEGTTLTTTKRGELDGVVGLRARLSGPARLVLPGESFLTVLPDAVLGSPQDETEHRIDTSATRTPIASDVRVPTGGEAALEADGRISLTGDRIPETDFDRRKNNPTLAPGIAYKLLSGSLAMTDITEAFLGNERDRLLGQCPIEAIAFDEVRALARQAIATCMREQDAPIRAEGPQAVGKRVGEIVAELVRTYNKWTVNEEFLAKSLA